jgi:two-component system CheB/CheR fusion protein
MNGDLPPDQGVILDPDVSEEELGSEIDNAIPTRSYDALRVVGLGGSAGSIVALQRFFEVMPSNSGMAFVVVLHLSPEHESMLSEILQRSTKMTVTQAEDGETVLADHVYVIPPAKHISLTNSHLRLTELAREPGRHMTVDLFFRSLADTHGAHSIAIVFSGGDGDGAIGIKRVKERGGLTIAQDPEGAEHAGMPRAAIATSMVDWVLRAEEIPARLLEYQARERRLRIPPERGPNPAVAQVPTPSTEEVALRDVLNFLRTRTGRDFSYYKRATIVRRVARRMQVNEVDDLPGYLTFLRTHPGESRALLQDLLISVTNFFRDREAFDALEAMVPALFRGKTQADTVRVWVPACATGEEAYSLAMLLAEHARTLDAPPTIQIFATDLDEDVLLEARSGFYPSAIVTDVSPERLRRFFIKEHHGYRVRRELRESLLFAVHDLLKDSPFSRLDLVSCRNLLIYLNRDAQQRVFEVFHFALRPDARLFLGVSESVDDGSALFCALDKKHRLYAPRNVVRSSLPVPSGPSTLARALALQERAEPIVLGHRQIAVAAPLAPVHLPGGERLTWSDLHLRLIERFGPPSLLVNGEHDILHLSQSAAPFLQFAGGEPSTNLLRAVHPMLRGDLRAALFRARQTLQPALAKNVPFELGEERRLVNISVTSAAELAPDFFLVVLELLSPGEHGPPAASADEQPALHLLEQELEQTKRQLRDMVEQHEASTEELKASNEELQAMNEELRSATEELETSREELQSINEELTSVNLELKTKVDELGHTNSDLDNFMGATAIPTLFLDRDLRIMRYTPPASELFRVIPGDVGRPLSDLQHRLDYPELLADAARVLQQLVPIEREVSTGTGLFFLARVLPYRSGEDRIAGVVLTFINITERHLAQAHLREAQRDLEARVIERTAQLDAVNAALRQEILHHQRAEKARQELQRRLVTAQEEERGRISRELHDEAGQQITALMLSLKALESAAPGPEIPLKLKELRVTTERLAREIHQLATELRPVALDQLGLARALTGYLDAWLARTGIAVDFVSAGIEDARLPPPVETTLYRIVQEAMNNVYKHASANSVSVIIERRGDHAVCIVEDDGTGFDPDALTDSDAQARIGIAGMRERAALVGGELTIESAADRGTTVRVKLPLR